MQPFIRSNLTPDVELIVIMVFCACVVASSWYSRAFGFFSCPLNVAVQVVFNFYACVIYFDYCVMLQQIVFVLQRQEALIRETLQPGTKHQRTKNRNKTRANFSLLQYSGEACGAKTTRPRPN